MRLSTILTALAITILLATSAFAHRVNVFAWTEGTTVHTESKFSSGKKAQQSRVTATDKKTGRVLATGTTDRDGRWSFVLPEDIAKKKDPVVITLDAGQGHANTWTLEREDFEEHQSQSVQSPSVFANASPEKSLVSTTPATSNSSSPTITLTKTELDSLISTAVRKELAPHSAKIAKLAAMIEQPEPNMKDIIGGIGYILGLLGLAAYIRYRKQA